MDGVALGDLGIMLPGSIGIEALTNESGAFSAASNLDDVITYICLAMVVSASDFYKLKLGLKLPQNAPLGYAGGSTDINDKGNGGMDVPGVITEEERRERRQI
ncbi:hypothetical protein VTI74DRAFT_6099 [Chaetomium olivicolor]